MAGKELELATQDSGRDGTLIMENAEVIFRNFEGREGQYNREGDRNFCVLLPDHVADKMKADGWNVKHLRPRDGEETGTAYIQVSVGFKGRPPLMVMITSKGRVRICAPDEQGKIDESEAILFDWADIDKVDLIIRPYHWNVSGKTGVKAYLKSMFVVIHEDYLELKYADVPELNMTAADHENNVRAIEATTELLSMNADESLPGDIVDADIVEDGF